MSFKERLIETFVINSFIGTNCGFEKGVPEFLIEEFRQDILFDFGAIAPLENESMPELICPNCRAKFRYKKTDNR